jgi:uncharacterized protein (DUF1800 family)
MASHKLLQPYEPTDQNPFDSVKAAHLLNRAGFGGTIAEVGKVLELGPIAAVDWLMDFPDQSAEEQGKDVPDLSSLAGTPATFKDLAAQVGAGKTVEEKKAIRQKIRMANGEANRAIVNWWMRRMTDGPHPLQEKLTLFWHGHFVTSDKDERAAELMWKQNELLRKMSAGNFHQFVRAISRDPAMLDYLNNTQNRKAHPNENYARELMELFTLGIGNYTETDVKQGARAFTGWAHDGQDYVFRKFDHDAGPKTFLGRTGNFDGDDIIDIILSPVTAARFVGCKLFRYFAYEEIEDSLADAIGYEFRNGNYELRPLLKMILTSNAFYSEQAIGSQIKCPIQLVLGTVRLLNLVMPAEGAILGPLNQMGQVPLSPPNVRGWPGGRMWINTSTLFVRYNTGYRLLDGQLPRVDSSKFAEETKDAPDAGAVADYWINRLIQRPVSGEKRQVLVDALGHDFGDEKNVRKMLQLIMSMPEYQLC